MARKRKVAVSSKTTDSVATGANRTARSLVVAQVGVSTSIQFKDLMSGLMSDLLTGAVQPQTANAVCNAGGKLLKIVEMEHKYGVRRAEAAPMLQLT